MGARCTSLEYVLFCILLSCRPVNVLGSSNDEKFKYNKQIHILSYAYRLKDIHSLSLTIFDCNTLLGKCTSVIFSAMEDAAVNGEKFLQVLSSLIADKRLVPKQHRNDLDSHETFVCPTSLRYSLCAWFSGSAEEL